MSFWFKPTSNDTEPVWMPTPTVRSTMQLLEACIITRVIFCAWTTLHINIPLEDLANEGNNQSTLKSIQGSLVKIGWAILGILVPEYLLWVAIMEFWEAGSICNKLRAYQEKIQMKRAKGPFATNITAPGGTPPTPNSNDEIKKISSGTGTATWHSPLPFQNIAISMVHGFYIDMGGFKIVPVDGWSEEAINSDLRKHLGRVTCRGAIALYMAGELPEFPSKGQINDRSKADSVTKIIAGGQAFWLLMQCSAREASGLPLTLLEVNTIMHVMLAFIQYAFWFHKPQDVKYPTLIKVDTDRLERINKIVHNVDVEDQRQAQRAMVEAHTSPPARNYILILGFLIKRLISKTKRKPEKFKLTEGTGNKLSPVQLGSCRTAAFGQAVVLGAAVGLLTSIGYGGVHLARWNDHFPTHLERLMWIISGTIVVLMPTNTLVGLGSMYFVCFVASSLRRETAALSHEDINGSSSSPWWKRYLQSWRWPAAIEYTSRADRVSALPSSAPDGPFLVPDTTLESVPYVPNPTPTSSSLWKVSAQLQLWNDLRKRHRWDLLFFSSIFLFLQALAIICYGAARAFLVVEAFASVRSLPKGAYTTLNWVEWIPHL